VCYSRYFRGILSPLWQENPLSEEEGQGETCVPKYE
jgi:hypothetical protein